MVCFKWLYSSSRWLSWNFLMTSKKPGSLKQRPELKSRKFLNSSDGSNTLHCQVHATIAIPLWKSLILDCFEPFARENISPFRVCLLSTSLGNMLFYFVQRHFSFSRHSWKYIKQSLMLFWHFYYLKVWFYILHYNFPHQIAMEGPSFQLCQGLVVELLHTDKVLHLVNFVSK